MLRDVLLSWLAVVNTATALVDGSSCHQGDDSNVSHSPTSVLLQGSSRFSRQRRSLLEAAGAFDAAAALLLGSGGKGKKGSLFEQCAPDFAAGAFGGGKQQQQQRSFSKGAGLSQAENRSSELGGLIQLQLGSSSGKRRGSCNAASEVPLLRLEAADTSSQTAGSASLSCCPAESLACAGCESMSADVCGQCRGGFVRSSSGSCSACRDIPGFVDSAGQTCREYADLGICSGGSADASKFRQLASSKFGATLADLENFRLHGLSAKDACCACGGGMRVASVFTYKGNLRAFALGAAMVSFPHPRTAESYELVDGLQSMCNLHGFGLQLNASTGAVSGTPVSEEPAEVECQVEAVQDAERGLKANTSVKISLQWFAYPAKVLTFPASSPYVPSFRPGATYSQWALACTPQVPWLSIDGQTGALSRPSQDPSSVRPRVAHCTISAFNQSDTHEASVTVVLPKHWGRLQLSILEPSEHSAGQAPAEQEAQVAEVLDLVVGRAMPPLKLTNAPSPADSDALPPAAFSAQCRATGSGTQPVVYYDAASGELLANGHSIFRLDAATGEVSGVPHPAVLGSCEGSATGRCKVVLSCTFFAELALTASTATTFLQTSVHLNIRDDTCWQQVLGARWKKMGQLTGSSPCRERCRRQRSCAAYQSQNSDCFAVRQVSEDASCPSRDLSSSSCTAADFSTAFVRVNGCEAAVTCLTLKKANAAFLSGQYCPAADGEKDGVVPYYAKEGPVPEATLYLVRYVPSREVGASDPCPSGTNWAVRRVSATDFVQGSYVEFRGAVLACLSGANLAPAVAQLRGPSWSLGDALLDELQSDVRITLVDSDYTQLYGVGKVEEASVIAVSRTCPNPLASRREAKTKAKEDAQAGEGGFLFDDPDAPAGVDRLYSLGACECFGGSFGPKAPVSEAVFSKMPPGSGNNFIPGSQLLVSGSFSCTPANLLHTIVDGTQAVCETACKTAEFSDAKQCRYDGCDSLAQEINSEVQLYAAGVEEACLIADPERCWTEVKREKYLAGGKDLAGDCWNEEILQQCDEAMIYGGHGVEECGQCEYMLASAASVSKSQLKLALPESLTSGAVLQVDCAERYRGLNRFGSAAMSTQEIICQDGQWLDAATGEGALEALQCAACVRASAPSADGSLRTFMASSQQELWWLKHHDAEIRSWDGKCLATTGQGGELPTILFQDPRDANSGLVDVGQPYGDKSWKSGYSYGWAGTSGTCRFDQKFVERPSAIPSEFEVNVNAKYSGQLQAMIPGLTYTVTFQARSWSDIPSSLPERWSPNSCGTDNCRTEATCNSGETAVRCDAHEQLGANDAGFGVEAFDGSKCVAVGQSHVAPATHWGSWQECHQDAWCEYNNNNAQCQPGYKAVSMSWWAGKNYEADGGGSATRWFGQSGGSHRGPWNCPINAWLTTVKIGLHDGWSPNEIEGWCSDGTQLSTGYTNLPYTLLDNANGADYAWGRWNSRRRARVKRLCIRVRNGHESCHGNNDGDDSGSTTCPDNELLAGIEEYRNNRLDQVRFLCRKKQPNIKAIKCEADGCKAQGFDDAFYIKPHCLKNAIVESGNEVTTPSNGDWSSESRCPANYKAVALREFDINPGDVAEEGRYKNLYEFGCDGGACKARSYMAPVKFRASCLKNVEFETGPAVHSGWNSFSPWSFCPDGMEAVGAALAYLNGFDQRRGNLNKMECGNHGDTSGRSGCRLWTDEAEGTMRPACVSVAWQAKATCSSAHGALQVVKSSHGAGTRSAACPVGRQLTSCSCESSGGACGSGTGAFSPSAGACTMDFGGQSGAVRAMCTQSMARLQVNIGGQQKWADLLQNNWNTYTFTHTQGAVSAAGSATPMLEFKDIAGQPDAKLSVKNVVITDGHGTSSASGHSVFADADNKCENTRWDVELPASVEGTPYHVQLTYGDNRIAMSTSMCRIGVSGVMMDASHPEGVVQKGQFRTVSKIVFVKAVDEQSKGKLTFSGEAASSCSGIHKIVISAQDRVSWTQCGSSFAHAWELRPSMQQPGNLQLRYKSRSTYACVDPASGDMVSCAPESAIKDHVKQVFSRSYLPVLAAGWTMFASGTHEQAGSCVRSVNRYLTELAVPSSNLVDCGANHLLNSVSFKQDAACGGSDYYRFYHTCNKIVAIGQAATCLSLETRCVAFKGANPRLWQLDKLEVGSACPEGTALNSFRFASCGGDEFKYLYTCCPAQGMGSCEQRETEWSEVGDRSDLSSLRNHVLACPQDSGLKRFLLEAQVPEVAEGELLQGEVRYSYSCCDLPLAPPLQVRTGPLVATAQAWEGHYCPNARTEGRPNFVGPGSSQITFNRLQGEWCLDEGSGQKLCSLPAEQSLSPAELDLDESPGLEYTPLMNFDGTYKGLGSVAVDRESLSGSLLHTGSGGASGGGGGSKSKKFKELPKIKAAKFKTAKFEEVEYQKFAKERNELEKREVDAEILNWAPDAVKYAPHCLARESREMITGTEPYDGEKTLTPEERSKDAVGACYHVLGVDGEASSVETWGESGTPGKEGDTDWYQGAAQQTFPGLTEAAIWDCSTRSINRDLAVAKSQRRGALDASIWDHVSAPVSGLVCSAVPSTGFSLGSIGVLANVEWNANDICNAVADTVSSAAEFQIGLQQQNMAEKFYDSDYNDCNPIQNSFAKAYCDLSCVEDAVKKGDAQILDSIGTMNKNIVSELKAFFDHYVKEIFTRLSHMEDKSSHESAQLRKFVNTYAKAEIDAVNSNGKQLTATMNKQHSMLNKNLGNAAKQIYDLTHTEHMEMTDKVLAHTSDAIDQLQQSTLQSFDDGFTQMQDNLEALAAAADEAAAGAASLAEESGEALLSPLESSLHEVSSSPGAGASTLSELQELKGRVVAARNRQHLRSEYSQGRLNESSGRNDSRGVLQEFLREARVLHADVNSTAARLLRALPAAAAAPQGGVEDVKRRSLSLMRATHAVISSHEGSVARLRRRLVASPGGLAGGRKADRLAPVEAEATLKWISEGQQLVEVDKAMVRIRQAAEKYLDAAADQPGHVRGAASLVEQYVGACSADFEEMQVAVEKAMAAGKKASKAARLAMQSVAQELGLLADVLVDGHLLSLAIEGAAGSAAAAAPPHGRLLELLQLGSSQGSQEEELQAGTSARSLLQWGSLWAAVHQDVGAELAALLPGQLLGKTTAAYALAEELVDRHDFHGLSKAGLDDLELMQKSWKRVSQELRAVVGSASSDPTRHLGKLLARRVDSFLAQLAPPPQHCQAALRSRPGLSGNASAGWAVWEELPPRGADKHSSKSSSLILLRNTGRLLQRTCSSQEGLPGVDVALASPEDALLCEALPGGSLELRALRPGELVLCAGLPLRSSSSSCSTAGINSAPAITALLNALTLPQ
ncbi:unnamed protein product [Polarella glacialis]|uniref:Uncharacterized protein n=1 Tax=Polarella glacialis TaxID=89957 RepID=A0A813FGG1_POLGL|nr:unnamed protein product [Polarella glacialis]